MASIFLVDFENLSREIVIMPVTLICLRGSANEAAKNMYVSKRPEHENVMFI